MTREWCHNGPDYINVFGIWLRLWSRNTQRERTQWHDSGCFFGDWACDLLVTGQSLQPLIHILPPHYLPTTAQAWFSVKIFFFRLHKVDQQQNCYSRLMFNQSQLHAWIWIFFSVSWFRWPNFHSVFFFFIWEFHFSWFPPNQSSTVMIIDLITLDCIGLQLLEWWHVDVFN